MKMRVAVGFVASILCVSLSVCAAPLDELRVAAESGDPQAQSNLGLRYQLGKGVPKDEAEAIAWIRKSADQGYKPAAELLPKLKREEQRR